MRVLFQQKFLRLPSSLVAFSALFVLLSCTQDLTTVGGNPFSEVKDLTENITVDCAESDADFFNRAIWPTLSTSCLGCHTTEGAATNGGPALLFSSNPNLALTQVSDYVSSHATLLSDKPTTNGVTHSGGKILDIDSSAVSNLAEFIVRVQQPTSSCIDTGTIAAPDAGFADVKNMSAARTVRKAALMLQGRMPTDSELLNAQNNDAELEVVLNSLLTGTVFDQWLMDSANDHLLTRKYFTGQTEAQEALSAETYNYPNLYDRTQAAFDATEAAMVQCLADGGTPAPDAIQASCIDAYNKQQIGNTTYVETQRAIADEPLQLIRHVVSNDLPYSEILTADYMMMNPFTYDILDAETWTSLPDDMDASDWRPGHIRKYQFNWNTPIGAGEFVPSAGILSSPAFLARYPTTDTNRNRARARWTYYYFLGVDIERLAVRAMDAEELKNVTNPGAEGSSCFGCHIIMDPVAGAYQSFGDAGQYLVRNGFDSLPQTYVDSSDYQTTNAADTTAGDQWYRGQLKPGFNGVDMPAVADFGKASTHTDGLQWLAEQMVADDRFATGTAKFWFKGVFGREPMVAPTGTNDSDFDAKQLAYSDEQTLLSEWASAFRADNLNLKSLLVDMMMSPLYRGEEIIAADANRKAALADMGIGRLLPPEQLDVKLSATTGFNWKLDWQDRNQLIEDYYMFYGGIDSDGITTRPESLNSLMYSVTERMANEVSCDIVANEFWPGMTRTLFAGVEIDTDPTTSEGEAQIRSTIAHLMWQLWGEIDATEEDALWQLYKALYDQRIEMGLTTAGISDFLYVDEADDLVDEFCVFSDHDPDDGIEVIVDWNITDWNDVNDIRAHLGSNYNPEQTLRPWVGVLTMMLTDIQFLTE